MFELYTEQARRAVFLARYEATMCKAERISVIHLLLGICRETDSPACAAVGLYDRIEDCCKALEIPYRTSIKFRYWKIRSDLRRDMPLDQDSKLALAWTAKEAADDSQKQIDADHLLRGLLCFPNPASHLLNEVEIDLESVRAASRHDQRKRPFLQ
jgi:ATP-dependent Clp protease ATP-binding subunit ClpC